MKLWNKCICLTSRKTMMVLTALLISTLVIAGILYEPENIEDGVEPPIEQPEVVEEIDSCEMWMPTKEDIAYQDSMYTIIQNTQSDVDTNKIQVKKIIKRLDDVK